MSMNVDERELRKGENGKGGLTWRYIQMKIC